MILICILEQNSVLWTSINPYASNSCRKQCFPIVVSPNNRKLQIYQI